MMVSDPRFLSGLPVLAAVIECKNFVRAGEALGLTQSGVSRAIQRLEERLSIRIFERTSKIVRLTDDGKAFCEKKPCTLLAQLEDLAEGAQNISGVARGQLRVNVDPTFARLFLAPRLGAFLQAHPALRLELMASDRLGDMVADGFDVAIRFGEPEPSALIVRRLLRTRVLTCASPAYLKRHGRPRLPQELDTKKHECLLFRDSATRRPFPVGISSREKSLVASPFAVKGRLILNDVAIGPTGMDTCLAGHGVA